MHLVSLARFVTVASGIVGATVAAANFAQAAEGGLTNYLAGYYGDFGVAITPAPGLYTYGTYYNYQATTVGPDAPTGFELQGSLAISGFQYVSTETFFGARVGYGGYTTRIEADLDFGVGAAETSGYGDSSISPLILYWSSGNFHLSFYEAIILPTGRYSVDRPLNRSRNYMSFDSVIAMTWLDPKLGLELSAAAGVMANTKNSETDYRTGVEAHVDVMANIYVAPNFAIGLHGYLYTQLEDDQGAGAAPATRSSSAGVGPAILLVPSTLGIEGKIVAKWLHEFDGENRFVGDILSCTMVLQF